MSSHHVIIAGSTGLVGHHLLKQLIQNDKVASITSLTRRTSHLDSDKLHEVLSAELHLEPNTSIPATVGFICLGTTKRQAQGNAGLRAIDVELVHHVATQMQQQGVTRLGVISSHGAHPKHLSHYLRCKGQMERALLDLGFEHLTIIRPGPLSGVREQPRADEHLVGYITGLLAPLLKGPLLAFKPIKASIVAKVMFDATLANSQRRQIVSAIDLHHQAVPEC
ncbi:NAD(P)H-binding protein [Thaumasiovibrio sp. DFM-14]|uniref:NAD(P)H-binding protein n=1 Tax=Thaumasiovibrio sp. DFM-14 TaxID=3384792 RepID=UPI0039A03E24